MTSNFTSLPVAARSKPALFHVSIPQDQLEELHQLLKLSKIGPKTFETEQRDGRFGVTRDWLIQAKAQWENFDWSEMISTTVVTCLLL
jgi:microsomal epoxide hydrolase